MTNIFIIIFFFLNCFNLGFFLENFFKIKEKNVFERIIFCVYTGLLVTFFLVWIVGSIALNNLVFFFTFLFINILILIQNFSNLKIFFKYNFSYKKINNNIIYSIIFLLIITYLILGFAPPTDIDSLNYHLTLPKKDIEFGRIIIHGWNESEYMPMFIENMGRFLLLFGDETILHQFNWIIFILILISLYLVGSNLKLNGKQIAFSILFFILIKGNMWLVTTAHNELSLTFYVINLFNSLLKFKKKQSNTNIVQLIIISISLCYIKYHGLIFLFATFIILIHYLINSEIKFKKIYFLYASLPLIFYSPFLIRNFYLVGDPLYPLFYFYNALSGVKEYGITTSFFDLIIGPINFTLFPNKFFDGNYLGSPYLVFLLYSGLFFIAKSKKFKDLLLFSLIYYIFWFYGLSQQVRYLLPVLALISIYSAFIFFEILTILKNKAAKYLYFFIFFIFFLNQLIFLAGYFAIKSPVALGLISKDKYLLNGIDTDYSFYKSCKFLNKELGDNNYLPQVIYLSYYCPQKKSLRVKNRNFLEKKNLTELEIKNYLISNKIKFIFLQLSDRKIIETGYSFRTVNLINKNLDIIISKNTKIVYQDFQARIYQLLF